MPCSAQNVETAPRGACSGHCEIARRTRASMGSWAATAAASRWKCHHQDHRKCHRCPDAELSPMSCDMAGCAGVATGVADQLVQLAEEANRRDARFCRLFAGFDAAVDAPEDGA